MFCNSIRLMEGPFLVIASEELRPYQNQKIIYADGTANLPFKRIKGNSLLQVHSWGKHLLLSFHELYLRIHFLLFGSYRIGNPRPRRIPKLRLDFGYEQIYFYSCAIKIIEKNFKDHYDWGIDLMSPAWDSLRALTSIRLHPDSQVSDMLMDQDIFAGLGNIIKNEVLFNLKIHPETKIKDLTLQRQKQLVQEAESYAWQFYDWKKKNILKRNWKIMRQKVCPVCGGKVKKKMTGKLKRISHFCPRCQVKP